MKRLGLTLALLILAAVACEGDTEGSGGVPCGTNTCTAAEYCCDTSCGQCAPNGVACPDSC